MREVPQQNDMLDQLSEAQAMAGWFEKYLHGIDQTVGDLPSLAAQRIDLIVGEQAPNGKIEAIARRLMQLTGDAQSDMAYFVCGYPHEAMRLFASPRFVENIRAFKRQPEVDRLNDGSVAGDKRSPQPRRSSISKSAGRTAVLARPDMDAVLVTDDVPDWRERALCAQTDPEIFYPEKGGSTRDAKKVCLNCDVMPECLEFALANNERFGIWGGKSERERRRQAKAPESFKIQLQDERSDRLFQLLCILNFDSKPDDDDMVERLLMDDVRHEKFIAELIRWYQETASALSKTSHNNLLKYFKGTPLSEGWKLPIERTRLHKDITRLHTFINADEQTIDDPLLYCWDASDDGILADRVA